MKKTTISLIISLLAFSAFAQNTKVIDSPSGTVISNLGGTDIPHSSSILDIRSTNKGVLLPRMLTSSRDAIASPQAGLLVYNTSTNQFDFHNGTSWQQLYLGNQWGVNGAKYYYNGGNVGIGVSDPLFKLDVSGAINTNSNMSAAYIGVGTTSPNYKLHIYDGSVAFYNTTDLKTWSINYNSSNNGIQFNEDGATSRMNIENGGNVGIGITNPAYKLDVAGTVHTSSSITVDGNATVDGSMTVNNGLGVAYNASSSTNLRIYRFTTANFHAVLGPHASAVTSIVFGGGFTSTPTVLVGDIESTGGTSGELDRVILVLRGCTYSSGTNTTSCIAKIVNTDSASLDYNITWNCVAIGN